MTYDYQILEEKFKKLPLEMQVAMTSVDISNTIKEIGERYGLKLDKEEILFDQTAYVMLGLSPSNEFVKNLSREADIDHDTAENIAKDINNEVFTKIKISIKSVQDKKENEISTVERAGGFEIEGVIKKEDGVSPQNNIDVETKNELLSSIEKPPATPPAFMRIQTKTHTDPIVDHLLSNPTASVKEEIKTKQSGMDPYRETIE